MNYFKYTPYIYLLAGLFFVYSGITKWNNNTDQSYIYFFMAILGVAMFFFRRKFAEKFNNRNNNQ